MPRLLPTILLTMSFPAHAAWLHLCPATAAGAGAAQAVVTRPDGSQARLFIDDHPGLPGCASAALGVDAAQAEALHPLPVDAVVGQTILLQGQQRGAAFVVSGATLPAPQPAPEPPAPMPLRANLLRQMQVRSFGVEERVHAELAGGELRIRCGAGGKPAGVVLSGPWYLPRADVRLALAFSGQGSFTGQAAGAARAQAGSALDAGSLAAGASQTAQLALPSGLDRAAWQQFVLVCPQQDAALNLHSLALAPAAGVVPPRATWVWQAGDWRLHGAALLDWAQQAGVAQLFIAVPLDGLAVREPAALAAFVRSAHARGIAVSSADGDPRMVLPSEHAAAVNRVRAYAAYNAAAGKPARLDGMQFDVEPYLLPGYELATHDWDRRYLQLAQALRHAAGPMRLEFVVPYWWGGRAGLLRGLAREADALTVMDYRTAPDEIYRFAVPFLDWAQEHGKQVRIALEAGPVAPETQRRYVRAGQDEPGDLLLLQPGGQPVLVLLRRRVAAAAAPAFRLQTTVEFDGSATTFHADKAALLRAIGPLERDFSAWRGFAGIALHELR